MIQSTQHISWNLVILVASEGLIYRPKTESARTTFLCKQESSDNIPDKTNIEHLFESLALKNTQLWETSSFCWLNQTFMPSTSIQNKDILSFTKSLSNIWRQLSSLSTALSYSVFTARVMLTIQCLAPQYTYDSPFPMDMWVISALMTMYSKWVEHLTTDNCLLPLCK